MPSPYLRTVLKTLKWLAIVLAVVAVFAGILRYQWCSTYPYGFSHCCLKAVGLSLHQYAQDHGGFFPAGGGCPEASLSLLSREPYGLVGAELCGKTKSAAAATEILARGELLGPDTCDWHYVEGLTTSDCSRLALVWDKIGLGHNGQDLSGGHSIWRLTGGEEVIPASQWPGFLEEQERLMAARTETAKRGLSALTARVRLPSGEVVDHYDAPYILNESYHDRTGNGGSGGTQGDKLDTSVLRWRRLLPDGCKFTFVLFFNGWKSKPVKVRVSQGKAVPDSVIFEMEADSTIPPMTEPIR